MIETSDSTAPQRSEERSRVCPADGQECIPEMCCQDFEDTAAKLLREALPGVQVSTELPS